MANIDQISLAPDSRQELDNLRITPCNLEAEQALLGAILVNNEAADRVTGFLQASHFFNPLHGRLYQTMAELVRHGKLASPVTLKARFESDPDIKQQGGVQYLARLAKAHTSIINAEEYGRIIYDLAVRRELIRLGEDITNDAYDADLTEQTSNQIERAEQALYGIAEKGRYEGGFHALADALADAIDMAAKAHEREGGLSGISTGLKTLDNKIGGLQKSDMIIIAGRPSMGKTALGTNIAFNAARAYVRAREEGRVEVHADGSEEVMDGAVVGFFSLEMSSEQLATRIIAEQAGIPSERIRRGKISEDEFHKLVDISQELEKLPLYIDHTGGITIATLAARARRLKRQKGLGLLIVDYLQLLSSTGRRGNENRVQEVTEITTGLKALAKELNVPIIALSQLSRQVESRDDKRPLLSDLRESGSIEQDADIVMFVFREEYYLERSKPREGSDEFFKWQDNMNAVHGLAEIIISKSRHGPTGTTQLQFEARLTKFSDLAQDSHLPEQTY